MTDAINPTHYTRGAVECIDAIEAATVDKRGIEAACTANIIKYLWRYEAKNGIEDVKKARWYLERLLAHLGNVQEAQFGQQNTIDCRSDEQKQRPDIKTFFGPQSIHDPRTVEGVDVSFPTEKHLNFAPESHEAWEEWGGGAMPVLGHVLVDVHLRGGAILRSVRAEQLVWGHSEAGDDQEDIVTYRFSPEASHA